MYRLTKKKERQNRICKIMREGKERIRSDRAVEQVSYEPPKLRRIVIVIDFDFGPVVNIFKLHRTARIDSYTVTHNNQPIDGRIGWANFCKRLSAHFPRVLSAMAIN